MKIISMNGWIRMLDGNRHRLLSGFPFTTEWRTQVYSSMSFSSCIIDPLSPSSRRNSRTFTTMNIFTTNHTIYSGNLTMRATKLKFTANFTLRPHFEKQTGTFKTLLRNRDATYLERWFLSCSGRTRLILRHSEMRNSGPSISSLEMNQNIEGASRHISFVIISLIFRR